ncbi:MAG TPA: sulfur transferase domain-containing protein [Planctomycetota bacterium]|jgi:protein tyrosine/serine phosphatase
METNDPHLTPKKNGPWRRRLLYAAGTLAVLGLLTAGYCYYAGLFGDNFREVSPGKCYRSGQMSAAHLATHIRESGIKCVINMRGGSANDPWHAAEERTCKEAGCVYLSLSLTLGRLVSPNDLSALVAQIDAGPYPILLHCKSGSDRAGLASVLYRVLKENQPLDEALSSQLSMRFGHMPVGDGTSVDELFKLYKQTSNGLDLRTWIRDVYPGKYQELYPHLKRFATQPSDSH